MGRNTVGKAQAIQKSFRLVIPAITVQVCQHANLAARLPRSVLPARVVSHFHDPQPTIGRPVKRHRVRHQRFAGHAFNLEPRADLEPRKSFCNRPTPRLWKLHSWLLGLDLVPIPRQGQPHAQEYRTNHPKTAANHGEFSRLGTGFSNGHPPGQDSYCKEVTLKLGTGLRRL